MEGVRERERQREVENRESLSATHRPVVRRLMRLTLLLSNQPLLSTALSLSLSLSLSLALSLSLSLTIPFSKYIYYIQYEYSNMLEYSYISIHNVTMYNCMKIFHYY